MTATGTCAAATPAAPSAAAAPEAAAPSAAAAPEAAAPEAAAPSAAAAPEAAAPARRAAVRVRQAVALLQSVLAAAPPEACSGPDAVILAETFALAGRVAGAGTALYARRVAATGAHRGRGAPDPAAWLARVAGEPVARARGTLDTVDQVAAVPALDSAYRAGRLSGSQATLVAGAATVDPRVAEELLEVADEGSYAGLRDRAALARRRGRGEEAERAREARAHARRYCRVTEGAAGGMRIEALVSKVDGARLLARLEAEAEVVFAEARAADAREPHERYRADALVRLLTRAGGAGAGPRARALVRVDAETLRRGAVGPGGTCEVAGVGQVPVDAARELLGDCLFNVVVTEGVDVRTVTGTGRTVPRTLRAALEARDPTCVVPGCAVAHHLEIDHWRVDFARGGPTRLDNLARLCGRHHAMKSRLGWRLVGGPGRWRWLPPAGRPPP